MTARSGLTHLQRETLSLIETTFAASGVAPSYDEMKEALGLKFKSGIHRLLTALERKGRIRRQPYSARAIELVPDGLTLSPGLSADLRQRFGSLEAIEAGIARALSTGATPP